MLKDEILIDFEKNRGIPISGQTLADRHKVSRNAVWKAVNSLKEDGYEILSFRNKGYYIPKESDVLSAEAIRLSFDEQLQDTIAIQVLDSIDSTNTEAKRQLFLEDITFPKLIVANEQTAGRGRIGKQFYSPKDSGIYMSLIYHLEKPLKRAELITLAAAVAVVRVLQPYMNEQLKLKWVNDIFLNGKKICGILSEAISDLEAGQIQNIIVGIGINIKEVEFPEDISEIAGTLCLDEVSRNSIIAGITNELCKLYKNVEDISYMREYMEHAIDPKQVSEYLQERNENK